VSGLLLAAAGDVLVNREHPAEATAQIAPLLEEADIAFCNFEGALTDTQEPGPGASHGCVVPTANAAALDAFDVVSLANNHALDAGYAGLADTVAVLTGRGLAPVGAGDTADEAWQPLLVERSGVRVAFVAFTSVLKVGTEAKGSLPGLAAVRAQDYYAPRHPGDYGPGVPPSIVSVPNEADMTRLRAAVGAAREAADVVVASAHWGDYSRPWVLTDFETMLAQELLAAGADVVLGHHQHFFRGNDVSTRPVFYGLGHLVFDDPWYREELAKKGLGVDGLTDRELSLRFGEYGIYPTRDSPSFPFHPLARRTGIAIVEIDAATRATRCGLVPCLIGPDGTPVPITSEDAGWDEARAFLEEANERAGLPTLVADGGWTHAGCDVLALEPADVELEAPAARGA